MHSRQIISTMASFLSDENGLSFINTHASTASADDSTDFFIKEPSTAFDLRTPSPGKPVIPSTEAKANSNDLLSPEKPSEEDIRKMNEESERLAWELMQQESLDAYNCQLEFMRDNSAGLDPADLAALQQAMDEERRAIAVGEEGGEGADEMDDSEEWTYDRLLALGEAVGGTRHAILQPIG